ncbi:hypothetical protein ACHAP3_006075 [Botrytis cinerea]|uniref:Uncharacterized protein n=1 Tax=Botryotinia fuckeliana (strain T4) TaxID=999810 RepID=G2XW01_BOTF4|nr:hypothetical protein BofuT4_P055720.1 [Botrytis cinerea T4]
MSSQNSRRSQVGQSSSSRSFRYSTTQESIAQIIESLNAHRVNTLTELCRIERLAAASNEEELLLIRDALTTAWTYYVTSHNLLNELRNLTPNYTFSNDLLDDAKWRVASDSNSDRGWNYAWLILTKIHDAGMIQTHAESEAAKPEMWGGRYPEAEEAAQLAACFEYEWQEALDRMLRHWMTPPTNSGY